MNRRDFLSLSAGGLSLLTAQGLRADILQGRNATMHGQRERAVWQAANRLAGVTIGSARKLTQIAVFIDLNCPACAQMWRWFDTPERRHIVSCWIPVSYMNQTSQARAIALLRAPDPHAALALNYGNGFDFDARTGALPVATSLALKEQSDLRANARFWNSLFPTTPLTLYRKRDGTLWQLLGLLPEPDMNRIFQTLAGSGLETFAPR